MSLPGPPGHDNSQTVRWLLLFAILRNVVTHLVLFQWSSLPNDLDEFKEWWNRLWLDIRTYAYQQAMAVYYEVRGALSSYNSAISTLTVLFWTLRNKFGYAPWHHPEGLVGWVRDFVGSLIAVAVAAVLSAITTLGEIVNRVKTGLEALKARVTILIDAAKSYLLGVINFRVGILRTAIEATKTYLIGRIDAWATTLRNLANQALRWIDTHGVPVLSWWKVFGGPLAAFAEGPLQFYESIWTAFDEELRNFLNDPSLYIWSKIEPQLLDLIEDFLVRNW